MKLATPIIATYLLLLFASSAQGQGNEMVKMCLFYANESGHARSDPIINQNCASGHVHTFYGPQNFHPQTSYEDLRDTPARFSSTPFVENQSLYWHPSIYRVSNDGTYTRVNNLETSPYYRWDKSNAPEVVAFPPQFRMIAHSNDPGANQAGESGSNMLTECCDVSNGDEQCETWNELHFPTRSCGFLGIAMAMPTCWNDSSLGDDNDHKSHMAYTTNGEVNGPCPTGFNKRVPQVQLFVRINNYQGGTYQLSDGASVWHVDFFNGWKEGKLQELIDTCEPDRSVEAGDFNPPCTCSEKLTENTQAAGAVCDSDVRRLIIDEATDVTTQLPMGSCEGKTLIPKSWTQLEDSTIQCTMPPGTPIGSEDGEEDGGSVEDGGSTDGDSTEDNGSAEDDGGSIDGDSTGDNGSAEDGGSTDGDSTGDNDGSAEDGGSTDGDSTEDNGSAEDGGSIDGDSTEDGGSTDGDSTEDVAGSTEGGDSIETDENSDVSTDEEGSGDEGEVGPSEDEVSVDEEPGHEDEEGSDEDGEESTVSRARVSSQGIPSSPSCHLTCMDNNDTCQRSTPAICENYFDACKSECHEAEATGEIATEDLNDCLDEWCMDDKQVCYNEAESRCERRRRICLRGC